jgi:hypothetical protein
MWGGGGIEFSNFSTRVTFGLPVPTVGVPYFAAVSAQSGLQNAILVDLTTGRTYTGIAATTMGSYANGAVFPVGSGGGWSAGTAYIAAAMMGSGFLTLPQLRAWAADPWAFWYPQPQLSLMASALKAIAGGTQYNQTVPWTTTSALTAIKQAGKAQPISSTSALTAIKQAGKAQPISSTSALTAIKQAEKTASWTTTSALTAIKGVAHAVAVSTTSAVSTLGIKVKLALVTISTVSALTVLKQAQKAQTWTTTSALTAIKQAKKTASWTTTSALNALKGVAHSLTLSTTGAVSTAGIKVKLALVTISSSSTVSVVKRVGKSVLWGTIGALSAIGNKITGGVTHPLTVLISTTSAVSVAAAWAAGFIRKATLTLFGSRARMLLFGQRTALELTGMSTYQDGKFHLGETWLIAGVARDVTGAILPLTGATIQMRLTASGVIALDLVTPTTGTITSGPNGTYQFTITPAQNASLALNSYDYEVRATLADSSVAVLNTGKITVLPSKFVNWPPL